MNRMRQFFLAGASVASLVVAAMLTVSSPADAQNSNPGTAPVTIVSPLPLPVTGSLGLVPGGSISVANGVDKPVPVRDVDQAAREPFQFSDGRVFEGFTGVITAVKVPQGKRLVIEHVSAFVQTPTGGVTSAGLSAGTFFASVPCTTMSVDFNGRNNFTCSAQTRAFVDSDRTLAFSAATSAGTGGFLQAFVSGYYVPVP